MGHRPLPNTVAWDSAALEAFSTLKQFLTKSPLLLVYPDWNEPFYVQADASKVAVGGILSPKRFWWFPETNCFLSSGLNATQRQYAAGEIECWALIAMARKFDDYLKQACPTYGPREDSIRPADMLGNYSQFSSDT